MENNLNGSQGYMQHPILSSIRSSPMTAAVISKLVTPPANTQSSAIQTAKQGAEVSRGEMFASSMLMQTNIRDFENALELFPDIEMSKQTVISQILAPNNMTQEDINFLIEHPNITPDVAGELIKILRPELEGFYKLNSKLYKILEDALFTKGAHIELVLPESAVDHLINDRSSMRVESMKSAKNFFDNAETTSLGFLGYKDNEESFRLESSQGKAPRDIKPTDENGSVISNNISVTDNFAILKFPEIQKSLIRNNVRNKIRNLQKKSVNTLLNESEQEKSETVNNTRVESFKPEVTTGEIKNALYKAPNTGAELFLRVPDRDNLKRYSIGRPLNIEIPYEACIPVHFPGQPDRMVGMFALVDQDGYFLSADSQRKAMMTAQQHVNMVSTNAGGTGSSNENLNSSLLEKARRNLKNGDNTVPLMYLAEIFGSLLEDDLLKRVKNGIFSTEAAISRNNDIYAVMLARSLAGSLTQIVYIPKEFFTYFAFKHNANGTGRSLLADVKNLISLRAVSLYAKVANQVRNAISITDVNLELDPRDPSPQRTIEKVVDLTSQTRTQFFPWGLNTPSDIANWWHRAGFQLHVTGHPGIPSTKIEYSQRNHEKNTPSIDEDNQLNDMIHMHFGITPEMRDAGAGAQFATSIANSNVLFAKRIIQLQRKANELLSDFAQVVANNDSFIVSQFRKYLKTNWGRISVTFDDRLKTFAEADLEQAIDYFLDEVIDAIRIELPRPDLTTLKNQMENFTEFKDAVEATFDYVISDDALSQALLGDSAANLSALKEPIKAQIMRDWMKRNNFMSELFDITETDDEGKSKSNTVIVVREHIKNLAVTLTDLMVQVQPIKVATAKDLNTLSGTDETTDPDASGDDSYL